MGPCLYLTGAVAACDTGALAGYKLVGCRVVITDGQAHSVDSNDMAFQLGNLYITVCELNVSLFWSYQSNPRLLNILNSDDIRHQAVYKGCQTSDIRAYNVYRS